MMTLDKNGNYSPWVQPKYGTDANDEIVVAPEGYEIVPAGNPVCSSYIVYDVYSGWSTAGMFSDIAYNFYTRSNGRWTTFARPMLTDDELILKAESVGFTFHKHANCWRWTVLAPDRSVVVVCEQGEAHGMKLLRERMKQYNEYS